MMIFITWIVLSIVAGSIGAGRKIGFAGAFLLSLLLSPLIGIIIALVSAPKTTPIPQRPINYEIVNLQRMRAAGEITAEEYETRRKQIL